MKSMTRCYLDSNILFYFQDKKSPFHNQVQELIGKLILQKTELLTSPLTLDEFLQGSLRFSGRSKQEMRNELKRSLKKIFSLPKFQLINPPVDRGRHLKVVNLIAKFNLRPRDAYHLFTMLENKIQYLATFDNDFEQVFNKGMIKRFPAPTGAG